MDFPGNSQNVTGKAEKVKKAEKKVEKVVTTEVVKRRKPLGRRVKDIVFGGDFKGAMRYVTNDVMLPAFKNMIVDATKMGVERIIYGDARPLRRHEPGRPRISYNSPIERMTRQRSTMLPDQPPYFPRRRQDASEIVLVSRDEAELVVERLSDLIDQFEVATLADLYELVGLPSSHVDNKWGWTTIAGINIRQIRDGYLIELPPVEAI